MLKFDPKPHFYCKNHSVSLSKWGEKPPKLLKLFVHLFRSYCKIKLKLIKISFFSHQRERVFRGPAILPFAGSSFFRQLTNE